MSHSNRAFRLMKFLKKAEARRVKKVAPLHWEQQNPAGLSSWWSRGSVCACARVYIGVTSSALRRAWLGLVDGEDLIRTKPASTASILLFLWRFYALIAKRTHLPGADLNSNTHACFSVWMLSLNCGDIIFSSAQPFGLLLCERWKRLLSDTLSRFEWQVCGKFALWTHHYRLWNCCLSRTPSANLAVSVRSGWAGCCLRVITFVGGVLVSPDHWRRACSGVSKPRANAAPHRATSSGRRRRERRVKGRKSVGECCEDVAAGLGQLRSRATCYRQWTKPSRCRYETCVCVSLA